jgi:hypothetical protein
MVSISAFVCGSWQLVITILDASLAHTFVRLANVGGFAVVYVRPLYSELVTASTRSSAHASSVK